VGDGETSECMREGVSVLCEGNLNFRKLRQQKFIVSLFFAKKIHEPSKLMLLLLYNSRYILILF